MNIMLRVCLCSVSVAPPSLLYHSALVDEMRVFGGVLILIYDCLFGFVVTMRWDVARGPVGRTCLILALWVLVSDRKSQENDNLFKVYPIHHFLT